MNRQIVPEAIFPPLLISILPVVLLKCLLGVGILYHVHQLAEPTGGIRDIVRKVLRVLRQLAFQIKAKAVTSMPAVRQEEHIIAMELVRGLRPQPPIPLEPPAIETCAAVQELLQMHAPEHVLRKLLLATPQLPPVPLMQALLRQRSERQSLLQCRGAIAAVV
jgi:hypothetical protein